MTDPADLLQQVLTDVADQTPVEATSPEVIRAAAARERRRSRSVAALGALAAALVVAAPVALLQRGDGPPAPTDPPSSPFSRSVVPDGQGLDLTGLPLGDAPRVAWLDEGVLVSADGTRTELPTTDYGGPLQPMLASAVRFPGGMVVTDHRYFEGTQGLARLNADGELVQECATTGPAVVSALGDVAWACVHMPESGKPGHHAIWVWSDGDLAEYPIGGDRAMPVVIGFLGRSVVYEGWNTGPVVLFRAGNSSRAAVSAIQTASDVDDRLHVIAGQSPAGDGMIVDPDTGVVEHEYPGWHLGVLSPDGSLVTATPAGGGGELVALDVASGQEIARLAQGSWQDVTWEDDTHVLLEVSRNDRVALVRVGLDGSHERATPVRTPWGSLEIAAP